MTNESIPKFPEETSEAKEADFAERISKRPPFMPTDVYSDYRNIVEGSLDGDIPYDSAWEASVGVDDAGRKVEYDEVTKRRLLNDLNSRGE